MTYLKHKSPGRSPQRSGGRDLPGHGAHVFYGIRLIDARRLPRQLPWSAQTAREGSALGQRVGVRLVKELLLQLHRAAKELAGSLRIRRAHTVQFTAQEINQLTELRVVVQGNPLVVHKRIGALGGSLRRPIQVRPSQTTSTDRIAA